MGEPEQSHASGATGAAAVRSAGSVATDGAARIASRAALMPVAGAARRVRGHFRSPGSPRIWFELLLIGVSYWIYSIIRNAVPTQQVRAERNALDIWHLEQHLGVAAERGVNHWFDHITWLITGLDYDYATLHFIVTIGVLVWLFLRHPGRYAAARTALFVTTGIALVGFYFYPLAPPRLLTDGGFIDTVLKHHTWGSMASGDLASVDNQFAAMPSMHIGWSLWCGITIALLARRRWVKLLGLLYPASTLVVIIATANHFFADAVAGAVCTGVGFAVSRLLYRRWAFGFPRRPGAPVSAGADTRNGADTRIGADGAPDGGVAGSGAEPPPGREPSVLQGSARGPGGP